jgi:hypothetical protein
MRKDIQLGSKKKGISKDKRIINIIIKLLTKKESDNGINENKIIS